MPLFKRNGKPFLVANSTKKNKKRWNVKFDLNWPSGVARI